MSTVIVYIYSYIHIIDVIIIIIIIINIILEGAGPKQRGGRAGARHASPARCLAASDRLHIGI